MFLRTLRYTALAIIILILSSLAITQIPAVKDAIAEYTLATIEKQTGLHAEVGSIEFMLPFEVKAQKVNVTEGERPIFDAERMIVRFNPLSLFEKRLSFHTIQIVKGQLHNLPKEGDGESAPLIDIKHLLLKEMHVDKRVFEQAPDAPFDLEGKLLFDDVENSFAMEMTAAATESPDLKTAFSFNGSYDDQELSGTAVFTQCCGGLMKIPDLITEGKVSIHAKGPWRSWQNFDAGLEGSFTGDLTFALPCPQGHVEGAFSFTAPKLPKITNVRANMGSLTVSGHGEIAEMGKLEDMRLNFEIENLSDFDNCVDATLRGAIKGTAVISGNINAPEVILNSESAGVTINAFTLGKFVLQIDALLQEEGMTGSAKLAVANGEEPFNSRTLFTWDGADTIQLKNLHVSLAYLSMNGDLSFGLPEGPITGEVSGRCKDVSSIGALFRKEIDGDIEFKARFNETPVVGQSVDISAKGERLAYDHIVVNDYDFAISVTDIFNHPQGHVIISTGDANYDNLRLSQLFLHTELDPEASQWPFTIEAKGHRYKKFSVETNGAWFMNKELISFTLNSIDGVIDDADVLLVDPVTIVYGPEQIEITPLLLRIGDGSIYTTMDYSNDDIHSTLRVDSIPLNFINMANFMQPLEGLVSAEAYLYGPPTHLIGQMQMNITGMRIVDQAFSHTPTMHGGFQVHLNDSGIDFNGGLTGSGEEPIALEGKIPVRFMLTAPLMLPDYEAPLSVKAHARGPVAPLLELFLSNGTLISGYSQLELMLGGTMEKPTMQGSLMLTEGRIESLDSGAVFNDVYAFVEAHDDRITLKDFTGHDPQGGSVSGSGTLLLHPKELFPFDLKFQLQDAELINIDTISAPMSGTLTFKGNYHEAEISGSVNSRATMIRLPKQSVEQIETITITYINQPENVRPPTPSTLPALFEWPVKLNVELEIPDKLEIVGGDLTSEWRGKGMLEGSLEEPQLNGQLELRKGTYLLNGKEFSLKKGTIQLGGQVPKQTSLYVVASRNINNYRVEVIVKGPVKKPGINFRSNPALSERAILSLILFGSVPSDLTYFEGEQLSESFTELNTDEGEGPDTLSRIRQALNVDQIDISRETMTTEDDDETTDVSIQVGKYLTEDVFISVNRRLGEDVNSVAIEVKLHEDVRASVEAGDNAEVQAGLMWRRDY